MNEAKKETLFLASIPVVMALSCIAGISFGPLRHTGLFWMATGMVGFLLIPLKRGRKITFPLWAWAPYFAFITCSLYWTRWDLRENVQILLQILVCPILGIISSYAIRKGDELARYNGLYVVCTLFVGAACLYYMVGPGRAAQGGDGSLYQGFAERPAACGLIAVGAFFLGQIRIRPVISIAMWFLCFAICIVSESRMATFVLLALWMIHPTLVTWKARVAMAAIVVVSGLMAFNTSIIQERFFTKKYGYAGQGSIEDVMKGKFDSAGRFEAWPLVYEKSFDTPWFGHGIGESAPFVFRVWAPMDKPHNEYLKVFYEGGMIGLTFFVLGLVGTTWNLYWNVRVSGSQNWAAPAAFMAWIGFIMIAAVDNPIVYGVNFLHPVFVLVGASNGITAQILEERWKARRSIDNDEAESELEVLPPPSKRDRLQPILLR